MNDRLELRIGALRLARRRHNTRVGAWAAARVRLKDATLDRADASFAHEAIVAFGHALRVERSRRPHETGHEIDWILEPIIPERPLPWRRMLAILAAAAFVGVLLFYRAPKGGGSEQAAGASAAPAAAVATASPLRGRRDLVIAVIVTPQDVTCDDASKSLTTELFPGQ